MTVDRSQDFTTVTVSDLAGLAAHADAWDRLAWDAPQRLPTLLPDWVEAALRHQLAPGERWFCSFAYAGGALVGVLPVVVAPHPVLGGRYPELRTPFDHATPSGDVLLEPGRAAGALAALLAEAGRVCPRHLGIDFGAVPEASPLLSALDRPVRGYSTHRSWTGPYSKIDTRGEAEAYFAGLGNLRRNLKRYRKRLDGRGPVSVALTSGPEADPAFLPAFLALEAAGWKGRNGTAVLDLPGRAAFYETLLGRFAARGRLEWHVIRVGERVVVAEMGLRCGGALMLPKIAHDEAFSDCMPGGLLTGEVIRAAFRRPEIAEINHMSDAPWHGAWRMRGDPHVTVHLVRRSAAAALLRLPPVAARVASHRHVRPRLAPLVETGRQLLQRRSGGKADRRAQT